MWRVSSDLSDRITAIRITAIFRRIFKIRLKYMILLLTLPIFAGVIRSPHGLVSASETRPTTRMITDLSGREVRIPDTPKRVACLFGPSYEKLFAFGAADRISMVANLTLPWCHVLNPALKDIPVMGNYSAPDIEELLRLKTDLVIYHPFPKQIAQMSAAGLPVVVAYDGSKRMQTLPAFIDDYHTQIRFYGKLLGEDAGSIAEHYCSYMDGKIGRILDKTSRMTSEERPKVFYFCGQVNGPAGTQTKNSTAYWLVNAAGGEMLTHDEASYFISVTNEQMVLWNPDIIVVSTLPSIDPVVKNSQWKNIDAVKNRKVFMTPEGLFYWSHFSTESFLCIMYLAKIFHPDLFSDIEMKKELKEYYSIFYHYELNDSQAERILNHLPPESGSGG